MRIAPQGNPLEEAVVEGLQQGSRGFAEASQIIVLYSIPIGVKWIGITMLARASPRVQSSRPEDTPLGAEIDDRLTDVEDALEADAKPADLLNVLGLGAANGLMQGITIRYGKGAVVRHQQRWPSEQTVLGLGPPALEDDKNQARGLRIISVLN